MEQDDHLIYGPNQGSVERDTHCCVYHTGTIGANWDCFRHTRKIELPW